MKLRDFRTFLALLMSILAICSFAVWNVLTEPKPTYSIKVSIPKVYKADFTDAELWDYVESGNSLPISEMEKRKLPIPNYDKFITISLEKNGNLKINSYLSLGNLADTNTLKEKLCQIFSERQEYNVFEENSYKVIKAVIIKAPRSTKYGEVAKVVDTVKASGADPIILQIEGLPE